MTISQTRMVALIDAAGDALRALQRACDMTQEAWERAQGQEVPGPSALELENLAMLLKPQLLLREPVQSLLTYQIERKHFEQFGKWNDKRRAKQAQKRAERRPQGPSALARHSLANGYSTSPASLFSTAPLVAEPEPDWPFDLGDLGNEPNDKPEGETKS